MRRAVFLTRCAAVPSPIRSALALALPATVDEPKGTSFTKARIAETYDLVIGNPPFSSRTVRANDPAGALSLSLHDYFIARSIERLRPEGLAALVTSRWTMDKADPTARAFIASMADLLGAVRLPEGAMRAAAGTDVVVDILFFQKRGPDEPVKPPTGSRADRLAKIYNERFNNLVPRRFDGSHLTIPGASSVIKFYEHQKRAIWRILSAGSTYVAHAVGAGKTFTLAASVMEQKRLGLITKPMMTVPGHCLAQAAREFLQLYPTANILVADETNFVKDKRQRFLARAATANWDCIIITHSAFKFIPARADFERALISDVIGSYVDLLDRVDAQDRVSRKRIERLKEGMEARLEALKSRKDDMLTIAEIGVDQVASMRCRSSASIPSPPTRVRSKASIRTDRNAPGTSTSVLDSSVRSAPPCER